MFTNLLAHCDQYGVVDIHPKAIAEEVGIPMERVKSTLVMLQSPDPESRTQDKEGRRILLLDEHRDWGWSVVNYMKYRAIKNEDDRREQNRIAQEKWRNKNKHDISKVSINKPCVSAVSRDKPMQMQKEKEINTNALFQEFWKAYPKKRAKDDAGKAFAKRKPDETLLKAMLDAIEIQSQSDDWLKEDGKYIPYPATWLNDGRWMDTYSDFISNHIAGSI